MEALSKGLMDFSRAELTIERVDMNALVHRSIEFVRTQNRFDGVEWEPRRASPRSSCGRTPASSSRCCSTCS